MFQFDVTYSQADLMTFVRVERKIDKNSAVSFVSPLMIMIGILFLVFGMMMMEWRVDLWVNVLYIGCGLILVMFPVLLDWVNSIKARREVVGWGKKIVVRVDEADLLVKIEGDQKFARYLFGSFYHTCYICDGRYVFLWTDEKYGFVLPRRSMTVGEPEAFEDWLRNECDVEIKYI